MAENVFIKESEKETRFEAKRYGYQMEFLISSDGVDCHCTYEPATTGGAPLTETDLQGFLSQFKIREGLITEAVAGLLNHAASGKALAGLLLAHGETMVPGEDGYIALSDDLTKDQPIEDNGGAIDLRQVQSFLNVEAGDLVAKIQAPGAGTPGMTVSGKTISPQPGTPVKLQMGLNVRLANDSATIYAVSAGRVYCRGHEISVEDIYVVDGDVDFSVGNIAFKGFVEIKGDVLDGFTVKATKGIKVHGIIGVCTIESDGDIYFSGMNGRSKGTIACAGSISANYIYETTIECAGDVTVDVEVRNSYIRALGEICVNKRGISGGEYFALAGIESFFLGNVASLRTLVAAGTHYQDLEELNLLFNQLKQLIAQFNDTPKENVDLKEFAGQRSAITERIQEVRQRTYAVRNPKINVKRVLYEGVTITLGSLSEKIKEARKGPLSIIENTIEGGFRFLGMTPLLFKAQEIEKTFIQLKLLEQHES